MSAISLSKPCVSTGASVLPSPIMVMKVEGCRGAGGGGGGGD